MAREGGKVFQILAFSLWNQNNSVNFTRANLTEKLSTNNFPTIPETERFDYSFSEDEKKSAHDGRKDHGKFLLQK